MHINSLLTMLVTKKISQSENTDTDSNKKKGQDLASPLSSLA